MPKANNERQSTSTQDDNWDKEQEEILRELREVQRTLALKRQKKNDRLMDNAPSTPAERLTVEMEKAGERFTYNINAVAEKYTERYKKHLPETEIEMDMSGNFYYPENMSKRQQQAFIDRFQRHDEEFGNGFLSAPANSLDCFNKNKKKYKKCQEIDKTFNRRLSSFSEGGSRVNRKYDFPSETTSYARFSSYSSVPESPIESKCSQSEISDSVFDEDVENEPYNSEAEFADDEEEEESEISLVQEQYNFSRRPISDKDCLILKKSIDIPYVPLNHQNQATEPILETIPPPKVLLKKAATPKRFESVSVQTTPRILRSRTPKLTSPSTSKVVEMAKKELAKIEEPKTPKMEKVKLESDLVVLRSSKRKSTKREGPETKKTKVEVESKKAEEEEEAGILNTSLEVNIDPEIVAENPEEVQMRNSSKFLTKKVDENLLLIYKTIASCRGKTNFYGIPMKHIEKMKDLTMMEVWCETSRIVTTIDSDPFDTDFRRYLSKNKKSASDLKAGYDRKSL